MPVRRSIRLSTISGRKASGREISHYGYRRKGATIERDPETAPVVKQIFQWAVDGLSNAQIIDKLFEQGIKSPKGKDRWNFPRIKSILKSILTNPVYCGDYVVGKTRTNLYKKNHYPEEDWLVTENHHESIMSRELVEHMKARFAKTGKKDQRI